MRLENLDAVRFDNLAFRIKGNPQMGYTTIFKVELKDATDQSSHYYVRGVTDRWQDIVIPLKDFQGTANFVKSQGVRHHLRRRNGDRKKRSDLS